MFYIHSVFSFSSEVNNFLIALLWFVVQTRLKNVLLTDFLPNTHRNSNSKMYGTKHRVKNGLGWKEPQSPPSSNPLLWANCYTSHQAAQGPLQPGLEIFFQLALLRLCHSFLSKLSFRLFDLQLLWPFLTQYYIACLYHHWCLTNVKILLPIFTIPTADILFLIFPTIATKMTQCKYVYIAYSTGAC